jgi:2-polyprenyl-6-methoxyphenol hydroxylase-like FAD-dependent oxidoreductase
MPTAPASDWRKGHRVAIVGAGPAGVSAALALLGQGFDVVVFEKHPAPKPIGGAVLLSVPVLAVLRHYGVDVENFGSFTVTEFRNNKGHVRARLPFNPDVENAMGIRGWHYGVLRSNAFARMMELLPGGVVVPNARFAAYTETDDGVRVEFADGTSVEADILVGADGIQSGVSTQAFGTPPLFHVGLRVWLAWCDPVDGIPPNLGVISHSDRIQASYFPMLHDGKPGYEWWIVEPVPAHATQPDDVKAYVSDLLRDFPENPFARFPALTDFNSQIFCWDIYNRPSLPKWSTGRVICLGDAVHPVSPYAAYGMGMAIEDGYFLARSLAGCNLSDAVAVTAALRRFEADRVGYVNHHVEFARKLGNLFHRLPYPLAKLRDFAFDRTSFLSRMISRDYLADAEKMSMSLQELHVR